METASLSKIANPFECLKCDYRCKKGSDYKKHLATKKHINKEEIAAPAPASLATAPAASATLALAPAASLALAPAASLALAPAATLALAPAASLAKELKCLRCDKQYQTSSGLWKHTKICDYVPPKKNKLYKKEDIVTVLLKENTDFKNIIMDLVKSNTDLQKQMLEVCKKI